ncbi:hypothetical protein [Solicola gregarius]|uniref:Uncharacterized protein n=1 Tax=Solicola gregarius TaxID=2908642 RepID=A0AA46TLG7_9ACTN|nr:hypothetical protein [Solicola gregarius]UYM07323.1 hypothetical protein L0C25_09690 [Solicola gregarius]
MIEFHRARLMAIDNWSTVQGAMAAQGDSVSAIAHALGVSHLGAHSVIAMANGPLPSRRHVESQLNSLDQLRRIVDGT